MQICKKSFFIIICALLFSSVFAESMEMPEMPSMPTVSEIPGISSPTMDGTFYKPTFPELPRKSDNAENDGQQANNSANINTGKNELYLSDATSANDVLPSLLLNNSTLTAQDISSLYDYGLFSDVSSLNTNSQNVSTNFLLNQVLTSLNELKEEQKSVTPAEKSSFDQEKEDSQTFRKRNPSILRFKINGYSITESLTTVFFSEPEADGTFLLTADRQYFADYKSRNETFYILFKSKNTSGGLITYEVQPSVVQDYKNENSFIYKLAAQKNLTAEKTGNLVVLHSDGTDSGSNNINVEILLNLDN